MANRNFPSQKIFSGHVMPVLIDCHFTVASSDAGGNGITGLQGPYVQAVYMHTNATPSSGNPNPASGTILVQLQDNFNKLYSMRHAITSPSSGSSLKVDDAALTPGVAYTITTLGNATLAQWQLVGVPKGITPAVGVSFICLNAGGSANTSTSRVQATATAGSGIDHIEIVPEASADIAPNPGAAQGWGAQFILQCYSGGSKTAPADGSVIRLEFYLSNSSVTVQGE